MTTAADFPLLPFSEAIESLKRRGHNLTPTAHWTELWHSAHSTSFTVARSAGYDILGDIHAALVKAEAQGLPFRDFAKELTPLLQAKGWWGRTEDGTQLGSQRRLRTIYDVNMRTSAARGNWERQQSLKNERPFLRYVCLLDGKTRPLHKAWHGTVLPIDDPWWHTHYPPNGWNCRCGAEDLSQDDLDRFGYKVSPAAPDDGYTDWKHPVTGEIRQVPNGIDPGFDYHIGAVDAPSQAAQAAKMAMEKIAALPAPLGAAAFAQFPALAEHLKADAVTWLEGIAESVVNGTYQISRDMRIVGCISPAVLEWMNINLGKVPQSAALSITHERVGHLMRTNKMERGQAMAPEDVPILPAILRKPATVYWDRGYGESETEQMREPGLIYVWDTGDKKVGKVIVRVDFVEKLRIEGQKGRPKVISNAVRSARVGISQADLTEKAGYIEIKGDL